MSITLQDEEVALAYEPPPDLPVLVYGVGYGEALASPDPVDTVEVTWSLRDRPGQFTSIQSLLGDWRDNMDALIRLTVFRIESVYYILGDWPAPTPLPTDLPPIRPGDVPFE